MPEPSSSAFLPVPRHGSRWLLWGVTLLALAVIQATLLLAFTSFAKDKAKETCAFASSLDPSAFKKAEKLFQQGFKNDKLTVLKLHKGTLYANLLSNYTPKIVTLLGLLCSTLPLLSHHAHREHEYMLINCCSMPFPEHVKDKSRPFPIPTFADQFFTTNATTLSKVETDTVVVNKATLIFPSKTRGMWLPVRREDATTRRRKATREEEESQTHFQVLREQLLEEANAAPWKERSDLPFWQGYLPFIQAFTYPTDHPRVHLVRFSKDHPTCVHARFTPRLDRHDDYESAPPADLADMVVANPPPLRYAEHKYLVNVGNIGYGERFWEMLLSGSTVLWMQEGWNEWWYPYLQPYVHYVPVLSNASDLCDKVQWLKAHPEEAERIANNGRRLVEQLLTWENVVSYTAQTVDGYLEGCSELMGTLRRTSKTFQWLEGRKGAVPLCSVDGLSGGEEAQEGLNMFRKLWEQVGGGEATLEGALAAVHTALVDTLAEANKPS
ncbi:Protein O-glucosyltransferase 1 [Balamuthia mandrillaris]